MSFRMLIPPSTRDRVELHRSAAEAGKIVLTQVDLTRYLNPPADTPYSLEYAFHLLGDAKGKRVLDLGCGSGEELVPLLNRGAKVVGIDISPELISIAKRRVAEAGLNAEIRVGSAYNTELPGTSVDVIFCMSLIHHLDLKLVKKEMLRILRPDGFVVLKEPIRFSRSYDFLRSLLPAGDVDISEYEHPLTKEEFRNFLEGFRAEGLRFFRLPIEPLAELLMPATEGPAFKISNWVLKRLPISSRFATIAAVRLYREP